MKKTFAFALAFGAALTFAACNTQETHDRGLEKPAGTEAGPANAEEARDQADDPNQAAEEPATSHTN